MVGSVTIYGVYRGQPEKMAALVKAVRISKAINNVTKLLANYSLSFNNHTVVAAPSPLCMNHRIGNSVASFHTTQKRADLMEFFDDEKNWGQNEVKSGRSWRKDELRLKSNEDLHKLWYILLKERNMLLTMEEHCKKAWELFPSPERIDKVQESMDNLEKVVRERNKAYHLLETGETGERPSKEVYNQIGLKIRHRMRQYHIPQHMNKKWHRNYKFGFQGSAVRKFLRLYNEVKWNKKRKALNREKRRVFVLMRKFPNLDHEALKQEYPNVDIDAVKRKPKCRGHFLPE